MGLPDGVIQGQERDKGRGWQIAKHRVCNERRARTSTSTGIQGIHEFIKRERYIVSSVHAFCGKGYWRTFQRSFHLAKGGSVASDTTRLRKIFSKDVGDLERIISDPLQIA